MMWGIDMLALTAALAGAIAGKLYDPLTWILGFTVFMTSAHKHSWRMALGLAGLCTAANLVLAYPWSGISPFKAVLTLIALSVISLAAHLFVQLLFWFDARRAKATAVRGLQR
jgi:hypothetical protein